MSADSDLVLHNLPTDPLFTMVDGKGAERPPEIVAVWPDVAPGSEGATWPEIVGDPPGPYKNGSRWVRNVILPTLTVFLPERTVATGSAIIIAPGGGFKWLSIDTEGYNVAKWMQARGVAAFVLKYRLAHTPEDDNQFRCFADRFMEKAVNKTSRDDDSLRPDAEPAVADGLQAMRLVRSRAAAWGIVPNRIGFMGFSAGGFVATSVATQYDLSSRPDFAAAIYGASSGAPVPPDAPPLFLAAAADDVFVNSDTDLALYQKWRNAGRSAELHIFAEGGHGFGDLKQGKTSDYWIDELGWWLHANGFMNLSGHL